MHRKHAKHQRSKLAAVVRATGGESRSVDRYERLLRRHAAQGLLHDIAAARNATRRSLERSDDHLESSVRVHEPRLSALAPTGATLDFVNGLAPLLGVNPSVLRTLARFGARSYATALGVVQAYPSLFPGVDQPALQSALARDPRAARALSAAAQTRERAQFNRKLGARADFRGQEGIREGGEIEAARGPHAYSRSSATPAAGNPTGRLLPTISSWPVKDQGRRGTCVAFSVVACLEAAQPERLLSEQFLYWAVKTATDDCWPDEDGTSLVYARQALMRLGVCEHGDWPYIDAFDESNVSHHDLPDAPSPSDVARQRAYERRVPGAKAPKRRRARELVRLLQEQSGPIAVEFGVFALESNLDRTNWDTEHAVAYGVVGEVPPLPSNLPQWKRVSLHAVAVVGYVPSPRIPGGGAFIFRNSWGEDWGREFDRDERLVQAMGYGQISADQVDRLVGLSWLL